MTEVKLLKNKLGEYLRRVKAGETIMVTERGKIIGKIVPVSPSIEEKIQTMINSGQASWNGKKIPSYRPKAVNKSNHPLSKMITEDRE